MLVGDQVERIQKEIRPADEVSKLQRKQEQAADPDGAGKYAQYAEIHRICNLPVKDEMTEIEHETYCEMHVLGDAWEEGFRLFKVQSEAVMDYEMVGGLIGPIGVGQGKCSCASTEIYDVRQGRLNVTDKAPLRTPSLDETTGQINARHATSFPSGRKRCVRVTLRSGQEVEVSRDHPVLTGRGWVHAADLTTDDLVATPRILPEPETPITVSDDEVKFIAYLLADGGISGGSIRFTSLPGPLIDEFCECVTALGGQCTIVSQRSRAVQVNVRGLLHITRKWGVQGHLSKVKRVPYQFYLLNHKQLALFLNRFWATDGHVSSTHLECTLASKGLIRDLQTLLLRFGVLSRSAYKVARCKGKPFDAWRLAISGKQEVSKFFDYVSYPRGQEAKCWKMAQGMEVISHNTNVDVVPISRKELQEISDELGHPKRGGDASLRKGRPRTELRERLGATSGQWVGSQAFTAWVRESGYAGKYAWLAGSDVAWSRVKSVEDIGTHDVYDLNVPGTHTWIGNGVVLHNTFITLMVANKAYQKGLRKMLLVIPSQVFSQLSQSDIKDARHKVGVNYPIHLLGDKPMDQRRMMARSGKPGLYIMPYSQLSTKDTSENLDAIKPQIIIADEAHNLANKRAARTRRLLAYVEKHKPEGVCLSGTFTAKSPQDYAHLTKWCLGDNSPLPVSASLVAEWAGLIDANASAYEMGGNLAGDGGRAGPLLPLVRWARRQYPRENFSDDLAGFRKAYRFRFNSAPGVVTSRDASIGTSLVIHNNPVKDHKQAEGWHDLEDLIKKVNDSWLTPNGDEIEHAIHCWKWLNELTCGFYNELTWPTPEKYAEHRKHLSVKEAEDMLERAKIQHAAEQQYASYFSRVWAERAPSGLDTPFLVGSDMRLHGAKNVPAEMYELWDAARQLKFDGMPERDSKAVRVCDYKIKQAVEWAKTLKKNTGALIWVHHQEAGKWMAEALKEADVDALHCPAGPRYNEMILKPENQQRIIVASMNAHGTGKNLQAFQHQWFLQWPRQSKMAEQTIGRTHRQGQQADELVVNMNLSLEFDELNFAACVNDALYIHQTTGNRQKLIYASYDPLPKVFPSEVLKERGLEAKILDAKQRKLLDEKFGRS